MLRVVVAAIIAPFLFTVEPSSPYVHDDNAGKVSGSVEYLLGPDSLKEAGLNDADDLELANEKLRREESSHFDIRSSFSNVGDQVLFVTEFTDIHYTMLSGDSHIPALRLMKELRTFEHGYQPIKKQGRSVHVLDVRAGFDLTEREQDSAQVRLDFRGEVESSTGDVKGNVLTFRVDGGEEATVTAVAAGYKGQTLAEAKRARDELAESLAEPDDWTDSDAFFIVGVFLLFAFHFFVMALPFIVAIAVVGGLIGFIFWKSRKSKKTETPLS